MLLGLEGKRVFGMQMCQLQESRQLLPALLIVQKGRQVLQDQAQGLVRELVEIRPMPVVLLIIQANLVLGQQAQEEVVAVQELQLEQPNLLESRFSCPLL